MISGGRQQDGGAGAVAAAPSYSTSTKEKIEQQMKILLGADDAPCNRTYCSDADYGAAAEYVSNPGHIYFLKEDNGGYQSAVDSLNHAAKRFESDWNAYSNAPKRVAIEEAITNIQSEQIKDMSSEMAHMKAEVKQLRDLITPAVCGDGKVETVKGEECDDSNTKNGDGCSSTCKKQAVHSKAKVKPAPAKREEPAPEEEAPPPKDTRPPVEEAPLPEAAPVTPAPAPAERKPTPFVIPYNKPKTGGG